jgi:AcrR family transcriptional regulator
MDVATTTPADTEPGPTSRVDRIVLAAGELLERLPLREVTTTKIAERAEVAISTLYRFFPDRDAVFAEIIRRTIGRAEDHIGLFDSDNLRRHGNLAFTIDAYIAFMQVQPGFLALWAGGFLTPGKVPEWDRLRDGTIQAGYEAVVRQGVPAGPELMRRLQLLASATEHCQRLALTRPEPERELLMAEVKRMVRLGLTWSATA